MTPFAGLTVGDVIAFRGNEAVRGVVIATGLLPGTGGSDHEIEIITIGWGHDGDGLTSGTFLEADWHWLPRALDQNRPYESCEDC